MQAAVFVWTFRFLKLLILHNVQHSCCKRRENTSYLKAFMMGKLSVVGFYIEPLKVPSEEQPKTPLGISVSLCVSFRFCQNLNTDVFFFLIIWWSFSSEYWVTGEPLVSAEPQKKQNTTRTRRCLYSPINHVASQFRKLHLLHSINVFSPSVRALSGPSGSNAHPRNAGRWSVAGY